MNSLTRVSFALIFLFPVAASLAEEDALTETDYFTDIPIVSSASRLDQPISRTPVSVTVIDKEQIRASGFFEIADLMRLVPGFQVAYTDARIFAVTYHGQSDAFPGRVQVMVDGRSVNLPIFSSVDWSFLGIQITDIERIEVIRGPNAPAYGANAFTGTINIVTRSPLSRKDSYFSILRGDPGVTRTTASFSAGAQNFDYWVTAAHRKEDGHDNIDDHLDVAGINFRSIYTPTLIDEVDVHLGYQVGTTGAKGEDPAYDPVRDRNVTESSQTVRWRRVLSPKSDISTVLSHSDMDIDDLIQSPETAASIFGVTPAVFQSITGAPDQHITWGNSAARMKSYDLELQHKVVFDDINQFAWGAGYRFEQMISPLYFSTSDAIEGKTYRLFFNGQYGLTPKWSVNTGVMVEKKSMNVSDYSPRLAFNYLIAPGQSWRISATKANNMPALADINWDYKVTLDNGTVLDRIKISKFPLESEESLSYEMGYVGEFKDHDLFTEVKLFKETIDGGIDSAKDFTVSDLAGDGSFVVVNDTDIEIEGIETQISYRPSKRDFVTVQYSYANAYSRDIRRLDPLTSYREHPFGTPKHTASLLASKGFPNAIDFSFGIYFVDKMEWLGDGDIVPSYTRLDMRVSKTLKLGEYDLELSAIGQNIGPDYYEFEDNIPIKTRVLFQGIVSRN